MRPVVFSDSALNDLQLAYEYLEEQEPGLGDKLLSRLTEYAEVIKTNPFIFRVGYKQVRQAWLKPFQYLLRYKIYRDKVVILQLFHAKQHPKKMTSR